MHKTFRKRKNPLISLIFSAIILLATPIVIYSLVNSQNFDTRNLAYEDKTKKEGFCTIHIPYVNTETLDINRKYQVHIYTNIEQTNERIERVAIFGKEELFSKIYQTRENNISETFVFSPKELGEQNFRGEIQTNFNIYPCEMDINQEKVAVIERNHPPEFLTDPYFSAKPRSSALRVDESYEYTLEVVDRDLDHIEYHYSFTPRAYWLHKTILESGEDGRLKIRFSGSPEREGSYLANIFVHDGHNRHISKQSWVISIGEEEGTQVPVREEPDLPRIDSVIDNEIILPEPQITRVLPRENSHTSNAKTTISANLVSSQGAEMDKDSIVFKLNDADIKDRSSMVKISEREVLIRYTPEQNIKIGEHRAYIYFKDSEGQEIDKEWTFTIEPDASDKTFLGIPTTTIMISFVGILLILFALSIPWIIYIAWRKDQPEDYEEITIIK